MSQLSTQAADKLDKFKRRIIGHPLLRGAFSQVMDRIEEPAGAEVAAVIGPTGSGKTTLGDRVKQTILTQNAAAMQANLSLLPVIAVDAPAPDTGSFSWREVYLRILMELKEPVCDWQLALKDRPAGKPGVARLHSLNPIELKGRVESAFRSRGVKVLLMDEAQHVGKMASGRRLQDQTDTLKALAKSTGAFVVLLGTYELIPLLELSGQVARRFAWVHLPRYRCAVPQEWRDFQTAIRSFAAEIQPAEVPDLVRHAEMLYRGSVGCVGILKSWLTMAYSQVLRSNGDVLTQAVLQATCLPTSSLRKIMGEIEEGERHWASSHGEDRELDGLLGLPSLHPAQAEPGQTRSPAPRSIPVGMRKPTRDPIGVEAAAA